MKKILLSIVLLTLSIYSSSGQTFSVDTFHIDIKVTQDGEMEISENIKVNFLKDSRGIIRAIPYIYKLDNIKKKYTTAISQIQVPGYKKQITKVGSNMQIRIGDPNVFLSGPQNYQINFTVDDAIIEHPEHQEIYWNLTGDSWDTKLKNVSFRIELPENFELESEDIKLFTGALGSADSGAIFNKKGEVISGFLPRDLQVNEGVTIAIRLPLGSLNDLPEIEDIKNYGLDSDKNKPWFLGIPILLWAFIWKWWRNRRIANKQEGPVPIKFYPPEGLTSAHVGAYIDHKVQDRDVISLIPYWATEGYIKVRGLEDGDMQLMRLKDLPSDFPAYEQDFFHAIFSNRDSISFSNAKHKFGMQYMIVRRALTKEIEAAGYYDPSYVWLFKTWRWPMLCILAVIGGIAILALSGYVFFGGSLILMGVLSFGFSFFTAPLSEYGQKVHDHLRGLSDFLKDAPEDDIRRLTEKDENYFSHMLPYAVAFGYDDQWMQNYERVYESHAPSWYEMMYYGSLIRPNFGVFRKGFEVKQMKEVFTSFPEPAFSSERGGGFGGGGGFSSGGGFSGGGFGGGGGSSW